MSEPAWVPLGPAAVLDVGPEVAYQEFTAPVACAATTEAGATTLVTAPAFVADGSSQYLVEVYIPTLGGAPASVNQSVCLFLDGVSLGPLGQLQVGAAAVTYTPMRLTRRLTPAAGSRVFSVRVFLASAGTTTAYAGVGGIGALSPGFIRITKVPSAVPGPSGLVPPTAIGTALPASPVDGQEFILTDSLTAPTYTWRLRYLAAKASNKWVFVGGTALFSEILTREQVTGAAYADAPTVGPSVTVPVAGLYQLAFGAAWTHSVDNVGVRYIAPKFGAATTDDNDAALGRDQSGAYDAGLHRQIQRTIAAGTLVKLQYRHTTAIINFERRYLSIEPVALGG